MATFGRCDLVNAKYKCRPLQKQSSNIRPLLWFVRDHLHTSEGKNPRLLRKCEPGFIGLSRLERFILSFIIS